MRIVLIRFQSRGREASADESKSAQTNNLSIRSVREAVVHSTELAGRPI